MKFMARTMRKEQNADEEAEVQVLQERKSILRTTSKANVV